MKIALVINELNIKGGTHKQMVKLTEYLASQQHEIIIYTKHYDQAMYPFARPNVRVVSFEKYFKDRKNKLVKYANLLWGSILMGHHIGRWSQVVNIHDNWLIIPNIYLKVFWPGKKIVWQINDLHPAFAIGNSKQQTNLWYFGLVKYAVKWVAKKNEVITVNVSKNKDRVQQYLNKKASVIYCGVDLKNKDVIPHQVVSGQTIRLLSVGVFFGYRNYETVLQVHKQLLQQYGLSVQTTIAGSTKMNPAYAASIEQLIANEKLDAKVLGEVTDAQLDDLFRQSHFFLFLNVDQSWGLAVFESLNYGLPVILSNSVGAVELLDDDTACIVEPMDAEKIAKEIYALINNDTQYQALSINGFNHVATMTWDDMYSKKVEAIFLNLLQKSSAN